MIYDYLIIGQGLSGSVLAYLLHKAKKSVLVIGNDFSKSPSAISSGIFNPITGRNLVKTWMAEELLACADAFYPALEQDLGISVYSKSSMIRTIRSAREMNDYSVRSGQAEYQGILGETLIELDPKKYGEMEGAYEIGQVRQLDIKTLCLSIHQYLKDNHAINELQFNHNELCIDETTVSFGNIHAANIIFCEGALVQENPYFSHLPFIIAKGELIHIQTEELDQDFLLNSHKVLMPLGQDKYWYGGTFSWDKDKAPITEHGRAELELELKETIKTPYKVLQHLGADRPTIKDRRPVMGAHQKHKNMYIFNGMGTKATSLIPYFGKEFIEHLLMSKPIMKEVDVVRFYSSTT
ncbi:MAG: FAD-binding oxidoreductase [Chitinophagales bacterium]|nr:FAD-binding oxidoreductase [Chitinophagales bacterium]